MSNHPIDIAELRRLHEAACAIAANAADTYRARNGRRMGIEADDGEKCWIVHSDDFDALCAAAAAIDPALLDRIEAEEWRPIEEAPKDGMSILAIVAGTHPQTGEPFVPEVVEWDEGDSCWWNCMWGYDNAHSTYNPTHWRHLPAAPTTGGADA